MKNRNLWLVLGGAAVVYMVVKQQQQQTAAQIIAQAKQDLAPLGRPVAIT